MKERLRKIIISAVIFIIAIMIEKFKFLNLDSNAIFIIQVVLYVLSYLVVGFDVLKEAVENIFKGEFKDCFKRNFGFFQYQFMFKL